MRKNGSDAARDGSRSPASDGARRRAGCMDMLRGDEAPAFVKGHDDALLGVADVDGEKRAVYDSGAIVRALMRRDGMDRQGAWEFFEYNIAFSFGDRSPVFVERVS